MKEETIVRQNMMDDRNYTPYCGREGKCPGTWPRTNKVFMDDRFIGVECPSCGWKSNMDPDFVKRYNKKWYYR